MHGIPKELSTAAGHLVAAALTRRPTLAKAWDYGWCIPEYRRSLSAAINQDGTRQVCLSAEGVAAFESALQRLLNLPPIKERYDPEELWGVVASLVGTLVRTEDADVLTPLVDRALSKLIDPPDSCVITAVANLDPGDSLVKAGPLLVGRYGDDWWAEVERLRKRNDEPMFQ